MTSFLLAACLGNLFPAVPEFVCIVADSDLPEEMAEAIRLGPEAVLEQAKALTFSPVDTGQWALYDPAGRIDSYAARSKLLDLVTGADAEAVLALGQVDPAVAGYVKDRLSGFSSLLPYLNSPEMQIGVVAVSKLSVEADGQRGVIEIAGPNNAARVDLGKPPADVEPYQRPEPGLSNAAASASSRLTVHISGRSQDRFARARLSAQVLGAFADQPERSRSRYSTDYQSSLQKLSHRNPAAETVSKLSEGVTVKELSKDQLLRIRSLIGARVIDGQRQQIGTLGPDTKLLGMKSEIYLEVAVKMPDGQMGTFSIYLPSD